MFKFYQWRELHPPLVVHNEGKAIRVPLDRAGTKKRTEEEIRALAFFLGARKRIGAFRDLLIFILGDHGPGNWESWDAGAAPRKRPRRGQNESPALKKVMTWA
ncbi:MAG: hypothetical protein JXO51_05980 [Candidatus Aminicenantes bacterium]|nr:hypothetical protein [Candidatus Aminicenantes bacterium]